jgi:hypothetical protein
VRPPVTYFVLGLAAATLAAGLFYTLVNLITEQHTLKETFR